jgi:hypothetical protein
MQAEHITSHVVSTADSTENNVSAVLSIGPIDHIVLTIGPNIKARQWHSRKMAFPLSREGDALAMNKIDLSV